MEEWRPIEDWEDCYEVSDLGRVRSIERKAFHKDGKITNHRKKVLKQGLSKKGYPMVWLTREGRKGSLVVHRLVAKAFIDNPENLATVNHKNKVKTDNRASNLEWMSAIDNLIHGQCRPVLLTNPSGVGEYVPNPSLLRKTLGVKVPALLNGTRKTSKGWRLYNGN